MRKQVLIIISVALASFLIGTMFSTNYLASGGKPNPVWEAIYDLQSKVNSLNNTVIEQQALIAELQTRVDVLNATKLGKPDYDSGWISVPLDTWVMLEHNLNTKELVVYVLIKTDTGEILQGHSTRWAWWQIFTENQIGLYTAAHDGGVTHRVMLWKIPEP